jgi:TolA-binding protein
MNAPPAAVLVLAAALAAAAPCFAGPAEDLLSVGKKAFADGQYPLAVESFQSVRDDFPESSSAEEAAYLLGVSLFYGGRWSDSLAALSLLGIRYPRSPLLARASYWMGAADLKLGSWQAAFDTLSSFLDNPAGATSYLAGARLYRAIALEGLGRDGEAASVYRQMLADGPAGPNAVEITYRLAGTEFRAGRFSSARDLYGRILLAPVVAPPAAAFPFVRDAVFFTGECELSLGNLGEAERRYRTILSLYPDSPWVEAATFRLADIAWRQRRPTALRQVEDFLDRFPGGSWRGSALRLRADILVDRRRPADAVTDYQRAAALLPDGAEKQSAWYSTALAQLSLGRKADAADSFSRAGSGPSAETAE